MRCLYCYRELSAGQVDYHPACSRQMFGTMVAPTLPYNHSEVYQLAKQVVRSQTTVTGVQSKLSVDIRQVEHKERFTIVGMQGRYILKPQTELYHELPENEDLTMHLAQIVGINVVPHCLARFQDGRLVYLSRRIDRMADGTKIAMEDLCQLSEQLTEYKYRGSYEKISKVILHYSAAPMLDVVNFWQLVLFCWLTGNSDMHLKNFSLFSPNANFVMAPAYDLVNTLIVMENDPEELALNLNGKKRKITWHDFTEAMTRSNVPQKVQENILKQFLRVRPKWEAMIHNSFLSEQMQEKYRNLIAKRYSTLECNEETL